MNEKTDETPASILRAAAYHGDEATVRKLVEEGVDVNVADRWGRTALSLASGRANVGVVRLLLDSGAWVDPHEDYDTYETPLLAAAENGHLEIVKILISAGANPAFHVGVSQATPESYARINGHIDVSEYLRNLSQ